MTNFIDSILDPAFQFIQNMTDRLQNIGTITARGLDLDNYLGYVSILGSSWVGVITSFLSALSFIAVLYAVKTNSRLYLWFKSVIKWW